MTKILPRPWGTAVPAPPEKIVKRLNAKRSGTRRTEAVHNVDWLDLVRGIALCVRCGAHGVEAAHRDQGKGIGQKTDSCATAALCKACHHELGNGKNLDRSSRRSGMDAAIVETVIQLVRAGKVGPL